MTYKKFTGYNPGAAVIGYLIVGIENRDGNTNVRFHQQDTLERIFSNLESNDIHVKRARMDCDSCSRERVDFYNLRGGKERIFDDMNNGFGWARRQPPLDDWERLPLNCMGENRVIISRRDRSRSSSGQEQ